MTEQKLSNNCKEKKYPFSKYLPITTQKDKINTVISNSKKFYFKNVTHTRHPTTNSAEEFIYELKEHQRFLDADLAPAIHSFTFDIRSAGVGSLVIDFLPYCIYDFVSKEDEESKEERKAILEIVLTFMANSANKGFRHPDPNFGNVMSDYNGKLYFIDFECGHAYPEEKEEENRDYAERIISHVMCFNNHLKEFAIELLSKLLKLPKEYEIRPKHCD